MLGLNGFNQKSLWVKHFHRRLTRAQSQWGTCRVSWPEFLKATLSEDCFHPWIVSEGVEFTTTTDRKAINLKKLLFFWLIVCVLVGALQESIYMLISCIFSNVSWIILGISAIPSGLAISTESVMIVGACIWDNTGARWGVRMGCETWPYIQRGCQPRLLMRLWLESQMVFTKLSFLL